MHVIASPFYFMKKTTYIIPGFGSDCEELPYKKLTKELEAKGYKVAKINPDWRKPISEQSFDVAENSILVGFSFGAVLAYLIALKTPLSRIILASLSPIHTFTYEELYEDNLIHMTKRQAERCARDIKRIKIDLKNLENVVTLAGEKEDIEADLLIPSTGHHLSGAYINAIVSLTASHR